MNCIFSGNGFGMGELLFILGCNKKPIQTTEMLTTAFTPLKLLAKPFTPEYQSR